VIKDIVVNLSGRSPQNVAAEYATSIAATFGAHLVGIAFVYEPVIPDGMLGGVPLELIESQREENSNLAKTAASRFETMTKAAGVAAETRVLDATFGSAASLFAVAKARVKGSRTARMNGFTGTFTSQMTAPKTPTTNITSAV